MLARLNCGGTCSALDGGPASKGQGGARVGGPSRLGASRLAPQDDVRPQPGEAPGKTRSECYIECMRVIGIAGWSGAGKTTLLTKLIPRLVERGIRVSTIKHAHHGFDVDQKGKDSHTHRMAGATEVLVSSANRWALVHELRGGEEPAHVRIDVNEAVRRLPTRRATSSAGIIQASMLYLPKLIPCQPRSLMAKTGPSSVINFPIAPKSKMLPSTNLRAISSWVRVVM